MRKIIFIFFAFVIQLLFSLTSFAENFYIKNYDITLDVQKNRDVFVTEEIDVYFTKSSHGIYRNIPISGKLNYENGNRTSYKAVISNVNVSEKFSVKTKGNDKVIKIGSPYVTVSGDKKYIIKYKYSMGADKRKDNDEFYFNIIGTEWKTNINDVDFKITFPKAYKELDKSTGYSLGGKGVSGYEGDSLNYSIVDDRIITGAVTRELAPREGLTIRTVLPENYFDKNLEFDFSSLIRLFDVKLLCFIFSFILAISSFLIWYKWGRDEKVISVVSFYPPKNMNSAEVGALFDDCSSEKGLASLVLYLASKGYIKIEDKDGKYTIKKVKNYDGNDLCEKKLMLALFNSSNSVQSQELQYSKTFYKNCENIIDCLDTDNANYFEPSSSLFIQLLLFLSSVLTFVCFIFVLGDYYWSESQATGLIFIIPLIIVLYIFLNYLYEVFFIGKKCLIYLFFLFGL